MTRIVDGNGSSIISVFGVMAFSLSVFPIEDVLLSSTVVIEGAVGNIANGATVIDDNIAGGVDIGVKHDVNAGEMVVDEHVVVSIVGNVVATGVAAFDVSSIADVVDGTILVVVNTVVSIEDDVVTLSIVCALGTINIFAAIFDVSLLLSGFTLTLLKEEVFGSVLIIVVSC